MSNEEETVHDVVAAINYRYADPVFENSDDALILTDSLQPLMHDVESGITLLGLMHLQASDIDLITKSSRLIRQVISDFAKFTRRACRQLVKVFKEKVQSDKDSHKLEQILRQTVKDLEDRKAKLEAILKAEEENLALLRLESQSLKLQNQKLSEKMEAAGIHLMNAGVFDDCGQSPTAPGGFGERRMLSDRVVAGGKCGSNVQRPRWRF